METKKFLNPSEVAKMCEVSTGSVIRWVREGKVVAAHTAGGHYRVEASEVVKLLESLKMPIPVELQKPETVQNNNRHNESYVQPVKEAPLKVLIVDDELGLRQLLRTIMDDYFPHVRVEEAADGFMAGWKAHDLKPDVVILDLRLPGIDGFRVCQLIRSFPASKHARVIAMTGYAGDDAEEKILKLGANVFLTKPFDVDTMKEKIATELRVAEIERAKNG